MTREELNELFRDSFLKPEILGPIDCVEVQDKHGESVFYPAEYFDPSQKPVPCEVYTFSDRYLARLSASGFLDCTEWEMYDSEAEAIAGLASLASD